MSKGSLSSKNKDDLRDIANALLLAKDGTKSDLLTRIDARFVLPQSLQTRMNENEYPPELDDPCPPTRPRLDTGDRPNSTSSPQPLSFNILNRTTGTSD